MAHDDEYNIGKLDKACPHLIGAGNYILAKVYISSALDEWRSADGKFLGLIERMPGRAPVWHRLCPRCRAHFFAIGNVLLDEQPVRDAASAN